MRFFINHFISPKKFYRLAEKSSPVLLTIFFALLAYGLWGGLLLAPADYVQGEAFRIIYVHVPAAFLALGIYTIMTIAAFCGFVWRLQMAYAVMQESASIGAGFTLIALVTGSLWGKPMWGTWWIWDARLTSMLLLLFLYGGFLLLQAALLKRPHASANYQRLLALMVMVGFFDIPLIHYSVYWWNTLHQGETLRLFAPSCIEASMQRPLLAMIAAFFVFYGYVLFMRLRGVSSR